MSTPKKYTRLDLVCVYETVEIVCVDKTARGRLLLRHQRAPLFGTRMRTRIFTALAALAGLTAPLHAQVTVTNHSGFLSAAGLHPLQGSSIGSGFLVVEAGTGNNDGRVTFLEDVTFNRQTVVEGLPSTLVAGFASGPRDATLSGDQLYVALGQSSDPLLDSTVLHFDLKVTPWSIGSPALTTADTATLIRIKDFMLSQGYGYSSVHSLVLGRKNNLFIADAGASAIVRFNVRTGALSVYADIPGEPNPTNVGPPIIAAVPTRMRWDGKKLRVCTMTGFPYLQGLSKIYTLDGINKISVETSGLNLATSFDYDPTNGRLVVAEFASSFDPSTGFAPGSGAIVEYNSVGQRAPISVGAAFPASIVHKPDGTPYFVSLLDGNMYRIDPGSMKFCSTSSNSVGTGAVISNAGSVSIQANDFALKCEYLPVGEFGLFFYGSAPTYLPLGGGFRCVGGPKLFRLDVLVSDQSGIVFYPMDNTALANLGTILPGSLWQFQYWYRDKNDSAGNNLSDGLQVMFAD